MTYVVMAGCEYPSRPAFKGLNAVCTSRAEADAEAARRNKIERDAGNGSAVLWFVTEH